MKNVINADTLVWREDIRRTAFEYAESGSFTDWQAIEVALHSLFPASRVGDILASPFCRLDLSQRPTGRFPTAGAWRSTTTRSSSTGSTIARALRMPSRSRSSATAQRLFNATNPPRSCSTRSLRVFWTDTTSVSRFRVARTGWHRKADTEIAMHSPTPVSHEYDYTTRILIIFTHALASRWQALSPVRRCFSIAMFIGISNLRQ
ncbi:hypothetical protein AB3X96_39670 [Paraburkholderia sp. BR13439]|uniref:Uncharacterized protein n=1 Tax=Paraburkholderia youngii TaxID=2782701 RepID=A0A7Y6K8J4_9BURK|nr:hypothetical protein [Paraburkholderia youngii]